MRHLIGTASVFILRCSLGCGCGCGGGGGWRWVMGRGGGGGGGGRIPMPLVVENTFMMTSSNGNISVLLALCAGNSPVTRGFSSQRPVTRTFVFFDLRLSKRLSKQSRCQCFETPPGSLWRHCNSLTMRTGYLNWLERWKIQQYPILSWIV